MISWQILLFLLIECFLANLPWVSNSLFFIKPLPQKHKSLWRMIQWTTYLIVGFLLSLAVENFLLGSIYAQDWELYVTFICLFIVFSFPGFIYQLYRQRA